MDFKKFCLLTNNNWNFKEVLKFLIFNLQIVQSAIFENFRKIHFSETTICTKKLNIEILV